MKRVFAALLLVALSAMAAYATPDRTAKQDQSMRIANRDRMKRLLNEYGPKINTQFQQSTKNQFAFVGIMREGLANAESFEIVITVTGSDTINFRIFPHYGGGYINAQKASNPVGLMRKLLQMSNSNFLFWGLDDSLDAFAGYTFTLESGFPEAAIEIVLASIKNLDKFVGELRPFID